MAMQRESQETFYRYYPIDAERGERAIALPNHRGIV